MNKTIPDHLLTYDETHWMPLVEPTCTLPTLRAREKWRQAQDAWGNANGIWRAEFEELQRRQLAERKAGQ